VSESSWLWGKAHVWVKGAKERIFLWQAYDVARKIYHPRRPAAVRVALLGNSRILIPARESLVEEALHRRAPGLDVRVDNLAMFGARIGDLEIVSRHLDALQPTLVILALSGNDLVPTSWGALVNPTGELLDIGWGDGPFPPPSVGARIDRWARTLWPLYRFRRFARAVIADRLSPDPGDTDFPDHFASHGAYFDFAFGQPVGAKTASAYAAWQREQTLARFVAYLEPNSKAFGMFEAVPDPASLTLDSPGVLALDRLLARLAAGPWASLVLLMPENPLLDADRDGTYHRLGFSERSAALIRQVAAHHGVRVVDARRWMPADAFVDFQHLFPDLSGFQNPLAEEILRVSSS